MSACSKSSAVTSMKSGNDAVLAASSYGCICNKYSRVIKMCRKHTNNPVWEDDLDIDGTKCSTIDDVGKKVMGNLPSFVGDINDSDTDDDK